MEKITNITKKVVNIMILSPTSKIGHYHKVTNITVTDYHQNIQIVSNVTFRLYFVSNIVVANFVSVVKFATSDLTIF